MVGYTPPAVPQKPEWLKALLSEKFFTPCSSHSSVKKNERNIYCVDCSVGICQHCLPNHSPHRLLQIRRYVYHDVIRMQDIQKLVDCAHVQPYIINSAKVVFLNQRRQPRPSKGLGNVCETCERTLQDAYKYCSVSCKIEAVVKQGKDLQALLPLCNSLQISELLASSSSSLALPSESMTVTMKAMATATKAEGEDEEEQEEQEQLSPNSVLGGPTSCSPTSSGSTTNDGLTWGGTIAMATNAIIKKLRTTHSPKPSISNMISVTWPSINRRKSTPHRSPIF